MSSALVTRNLLLLFSSAQELFSLVTLGVIYSGYSGVARSLATLTSFVLVFQEVYGRGQPAGASDSAATSPAGVTEEVVVFKKLYEEKDRCVTRDRSVPRTHRRGDADTEVR